MPSGQRASGCSACSIPASAGRIRMRKAGIRNTAQPVDAPMGGEDFGSKTSTGSTNKKSVYAQTLE